MAKRKKSTGAVWVSARKQLGLKQYELAKKLGISPAYLSLIESGQRPNPSLTLIRKMAKVTGLRVQDLLGD